MNQQRYLIFLLSIGLLWACNSEPPPEVPAVVKPGSTVLQEASKTVRLPDYDTTQWSDIHFWDTTILLDLRYATTNNFVKQQLYDCPRCLLRPVVARAVLKAHRHLQHQGKGLKLFDCYRPRPVQQKLWEIVPNINYVSPPSKGSMHNKGVAVDLTIVDQRGEELDMGTDFDYFGPEAHHTYTELADTVLANRQLLKTTLAAVGLRHIRTEWWHYSYPNKPFPFSDMLWKCDAYNISGVRNKGPE